MRVNGAAGDPVKYSAYGEVRAGGTTTEYLYTSQRNEAEIGLDYYVSRFYDPLIGHFIQADTIVPEAGSSKAYDRYGYANNNPVRYNDPSGHLFAEDGGHGCTSGKACLSRDIDIAVNPDGVFISLQFLAGSRLDPVTHDGGNLDGFTSAFSIDVVVTPATSAVFTSKWTPTGATESIVPIVHPLALAGPRGDNIRDDSYWVTGEGQFMTPQIGLSIEFGSLWGKPLRDEGAIAYSGPFSHKGASVGSLGMNLAVSIDAINGCPNNQIIGNSAYFPLPGFIAPALEAHNFITNSTILGNEFDTPT